MLPTGRYWHIIQLCSKDVLTGPSRCGRARSAANVRVRQASRQMRTLRSGWRQKRPILVELLTGWLQEKKLIISLSSRLMDKKIVTEAELQMQQWSIFTNLVFVARIWPTGPITDQISTVTVWTIQYQGAHCCANGQR